MRGCLCVFVLHDTEMRHDFNDGGRVRGACRRYEGGALSEAGLAFHACLTLACRAYRSSEGNEGAVQLEQNAITN